MTCKKIKTHNFDNYFTTQRLLQNLSVLFENADTVADNASEIYNMNLYFYTSVVTLVSYLN